MKQLKDLCLDCLAVNLSSNVTSVSRRLAPVHKDLLLERLLNHDRLTHDYLPHVTYNLFASTMKKLVINRCAQVRLVRALMPILTAVVPTRYQQVCTGKIGAGSEACSASCCSYSLSTGVHR